jgi:N,N'-diacetyllegionaminate synthase
MEVIAEVGSNFKTHDDCMRSVMAARRAGADAVKFQLFTGQDLFGPTYAGDRGCFVSVPELAKEAEFQGIEFMCTAFSPDGYRSIDPYVRRHKVASSEITDLSILEAVNSLKKPVILSTGGAGGDDIDRALNALKDVPVTILYCVVEYPARIVDFRQMRVLRCLQSKTKRCLSKST